MAKMSTPDLQALVNSSREDALAAMSAVNLSEARRMGGAPAISIIPGRDVDGFRKELNPSYGLKFKDAFLKDKSFPQVEWKTSANC